MSFQEYLSDQKLNRTSTKSLSGSTIKSKPTIDSNCRGYALEGGGVCAIGHIGVIQYLEQTGRLDQITHFAGTSAGAIIAGLLACRMPVDKLTEVMTTLNFNSFDDSNWFILGGLYRVWSDFGLNPGLNIGLVYQQILSDYLGSGSASITLGQIRATYGTTLIITTTSLKSGTTIYLNPDDHPDVTLIEAVQSSASYPLEYTPFPCPNIKDLRVDGGLLDNYPIRSLRTYLPEEQIIGSKLVASINGPNQGDKSDSSSQELDSVELSSVENKLPTNLTGFVQALIGIYRTMAMRVHVHADDWARTIKVNIGTVSCFDFDLSPEDKEWLVQQGYLGAQQFFEETTMIL